MNILRHARNALPVALVLLLTGGGVATAQPVAGQRIFVVGRVENPTATIVASGVANGIGTLTAESVDFNEATKSYVETDLATVGNGTLTVVVHGAFDKWPFTLDPRTCNQFGRISGTWTITAAGGDLARLVLHLCERLRRRPDQGRRGRADGRRRSSSHHVDTQCGKLSLDVTGKNSARRVAAARNPAVLSVRLT